MIIARSIWEGKTLELIVLKGSSDWSSRSEKVYYLKTGITNGSGENVSEGIVDKVICMGVEWESDGSVIDSFMFEFWFVNAN